MRAHTIITMSRRSRQRRRRALALAIGVCALVIPSTASAVPVDSGPYSVNATTGGSDEPSQSGGGPGYSSESQPVGLSGSSGSSDASRYSSLNAIVGSSESQPVGLSGSSGSSDASRYSSLNAITGPADTTFVSSSPSSSDDGFDWISALMGAGAALALASLRRCRAADGAQAQHGHAVSAGELSAGRLSAAVVGAKGRAARDSPRAHCRESRRETKAWMHGRRRRAETGYPDFTFLAASTRRRRPASPAPGQQAASGPRDARAAGQPDGERG